MKGIILAGGTGTRLHSINKKKINKHLLKINNKHMILYAVELLIETKVSEIFLITNKEDVVYFKQILNRYKNIKYIVQQKPDGVASALMLTKDYIKDTDKIIVLLADNLFTNKKTVSEMIANNNKTTIFITEVDKPEDFGVVEIKDNKIISIEEKPLKPKSNTIITGLYIFDNNLYNIASKVKTSKRNEKEIIDVIKLYLQEKNLQVEILKDCKWLDLGTPENFYKAEKILKDEI